MNDEKKRCKMECSFKDSPLNHKSSINFWTSFLIEFATFWKIFQKSPTLEDRGWVGDDLPHQYSRFSLPHPFLYFQHFQHLPPVITHAPRAQPYDCRGWKREWKATIIEFQNFFITSGSLKELKIKFYWNIFMRDQSWVLKIGLFLT